MKFRIGLAIFAIFAVIVGVAVFLFLPKGGVRNGIYFNTYDGVYAKITGSVSGSASSISLSDLTYSEGATPTADELASWRANLEFGDGDEITITISVENNNTSSLYVVFEDDRQTINNVTKTILNDGRPYTSGSIVVLQSDTDTTLFTITFRRDQDVITSIRYNYHIELKAELSDEDIQDGRIEADENSGYTYTFDDGTAIVTGLSASNTETNLVIPNIVTHNNELYLVTTIGANAFKNKTTITSVTIPNTVTKLGNGVFEGCTNLTNVTIPTSVTKLGNRVLKGCSNLVSIELPNSITSIGTHLFSGCTKLTNYNIPTQITKLSTRMFENCTRITEFTFPAQITALGDYVFNGLSFETLTIPDTITTLTGNSFSGITNIGELTLSCYVTSLVGANNGLFTGVTNIDRAIITANNNGTEIGSAFSGASALQEVEISDGVISFWGGAFSGCNALTKVVTPSIEDWLRISFDDSSANPLAYAHSLYTLNGTEEELVAELVVPNTITSINRYALYGCINLNTIKIPANVTIIGTAAFEGCSGLTKVVTPSIGDWLNILFEYYTANPIFYAQNLYVLNGTTEEQVVNLVIPNTITTINDYAFYCFGTLTSVTIPVGVTSIGNSAFAHCSGLTHLVLPNSVTIINYGAFQYCTRLTSIYIPSSVTTIYSSSYVSYRPFNGCSNNLIIYTDVESEAPSGWQINWNRYTSYGTLIVVWNTSLEDYNSILELQSNNPNFIFQGTKVIGYNGNSANIIVPEGVTDIAGTTATFNGKTFIQSVQLPSTLTNIEVNAFNGCTGLETVTFAENNSFTIIPTRLFFGCTHLANISIPNSVTEIANEAFSGCTSLVEIEIPSFVTRIQGSTFSNCTNLNCVTFADNSQLNYIGSSAFFGCASLTEIEIPQSVTKLESGIFRGCSALEKITLPFVGSEIKTAGDTYQYPLGYIFGQNSFTGSVQVSQKYHNSSTGSVTSTTYYIPSSLREVIVTGGSILRGAFYNCSMLQNVTLLDGVTNINVDAFYGCVGLGDVIVPAEIGTINNSAFNSAIIIYYLGNSEQWNDIGASNSSWIVMYYSEQEPSMNQENYWHYENGIPTPWVLPEMFIVNSGTISLTQFYKSLIIDVEIPSEVDGVPITQIANSGFANAKMTSIKIPSSITNIGNAAFNNCTNLTMVTTPSVEGWLKVTFGNSTSNPLYYAHKLYIDNGTTATLVETLTIMGTQENGITQIKNYTFQGCETLTSIVVSTGITQIGNYSFAGCKNLTNVTFNNSSVTAIGYYAFDNCEKLTSIDIPEGVMEIQRYTFNKCSALVTVSIPSSVGSFGDSCFAGCSNIEGVYITDLSKWLTIVFPAEYNALIGQYTFSQHGNPLEYGADLYINGQKVVNLIIPDGTTQIKRFAFNGCNSIESVAIPASVTSMGIKAFEKCTNLSKVITPSITDWLKITFAYNGLANPLNTGAALYVTDGTTETLVTNLEIPSGVTSIKGYAFYGCTSILSVSIPDSVTSIGSSAFSCLNLTTVTVDSVNVYNTATNTSNAGYLLNKATTVNVLASVVDGEGNTNDFLNDTTKFNKSAKTEIDGIEYYIYTKI